ncbi:MAG: hypothetical protein IKJ50_07275 [Clostridia bacterium]|nr:hypothetical protein [Clostridia bacterium]
MKKAFIIIGAMFLFLTSCSTPFVKPVHNDSAVAVANDGTIFTIYRREDNIPDQEIYISVSNNGDRIFHTAGIANYLSDYNYSNDIVENYAEIIKEYQNEQIKAYQFNWGIIYTTDNGETFVGVPKHEYNTVSEENDIFLMILNGIGLRKPDVYFCSTNGSQTYELNSEDKQYITDILNNTSWVNSLTNCGSDFVFYIQKQEIQYHSECGTFKDCTNQRSITVLKEQRKFINAILKKPDYKTVSEKEDTSAMDSINSQKSDISFVEQSGFASETISLKKIYGIYDSIDCLSQLLSRPNIRDEIYFDDKHRLALQLDGEDGYTYMLIDDFVSGKFELTRASKSGKSANVKNREVMKSKAIPREWMLYY